MTLILFMIISAVLLGSAYRFYGRWLNRFMSVDDSRPTPAHQHKDGQDFEPANCFYLLPQHFSAIAAAGPIVGPILAGMYFGWFPTWVWVIIGSILVGGVHDFMTLMASVRHQGKSIAELLRQYLNGRSYYIFLLFVWLSLVYVIIAFADVTAGAFVQQATTGDAPGPAVATSSILYLVLAVIMGLVLRFTGMSAAKSKLVFLPLVFLAIWVGPSIPLDLGTLTGVERPQTLWSLILLGYCVIASLIPVWMLLQPRGSLGGYFLYVVLIAGLLGIVVGGLSGQLSIQSPALNPSVNFFHTTGSTLPPLLPMLFITVACGACSGFHSIVASGTTSKQLDKETDARPVAYGSMLLEAFFACLSLACVMVLAKSGGSPDAVFAGGIGQFFNQATFGLISVETAYQFALLCFATFVFDTLDACTRLARYILMEITGWKGLTGMILATLLTLALPVVVLILPPLEVAGKVMPLWRVFWTLFGTSNQLLAALGLLAVSLWLYRMNKKPWLTLIPAFFMLVMTLWSLGQIIYNHIAQFASRGSVSLYNVEFSVAIILILLSLWLFVEGLIIVRNHKPAIICHVPENEA